MVPDLPAGIPIWIGQGAADVLRAAEFWGTGIDLHETGHLQHRTPITIGPFTITPYLADHSAFDAYSLLVEAGGTRLFYTGDLRGHGRKHAAFDWLLDDPPTDIDVLLLEGTNLRAPHPDHDSPNVLGAAVTEADVEADLVATLKETTGLVVVLASAQNIDRLVTVYRAALKAGPTACGRPLHRRDRRRHRPGQHPPPRPGLAQALDLPAPAAAGPGQADRPVPPHRRGQAAPHLRRATSPPHPARGCCSGPSRATSRTCARPACSTGGAVVWSLWDGYLTDTRGQQFVSSLEQAGIPLIHHHTSGHASPADLKRLVDGHQPQSRSSRSTPKRPTLYAAALDRPVIQHPDGAWWVV